MTQHSQADNSKETAATLRIEDWKQIIVQLFALRSHDELRNPALSAQALVEMNSSLSEDQIPTDFNASSIYQRENLLYAAARAARNEEITQQQLDKILPRTDQAEVIKLIKEDIEKMRLEMEESGHKMGTYDPPNSLRGWATALAHAQEECKVKHAHCASPSKPQSNARKEFEVVLHSFSHQARENFAEEINFVFYFHESFEKLLDMLHFKTQARHKPPHEPTRNFKPISPKTRADFGWAPIERSNSVNSDKSAWDDSVERPSLEYSDGVLARAEDDMSGYTLKDGPWIYQLLLDDDGNWSPQHFLASQKDFQKMIGSLIDIKKKSPDFELTVYIIHSQDRIGVKRWKKQQKENAQGRRQMELDSLPFDQEEFERAVQEHYGDSAKESMVEGFEGMLSHRRGNFME